MGDEAASEAISFGTDGWRATLAEFTEARVRMVGQGVATYLDDTDVDGPVAVGYDARETSRGFAEELARVLAANGRDVTIAERDCPTPVLAWTVADGDYAGGLMITASHNPPEYNGVKFVPADGSPALPDATDDIEARLADPDPVAESEFGAVTERDLVTPFGDHAVEFVETDLDGLPVVYDAMHGSGRGVTDALLKRAGADVDRLRCERDPTFGGTPPEPVPERAAELVERVTEGAAPLGIINDGDADRLGVVTPDRGFLDPNVYLAVLYDYLLESDAGDAVRTVSTSSLVDRVAAAHGQAVHETAVGFKWVAEAMGEHDALCGGEESGGFGVTAHLRNKDGVLLALLTAAAHVAEPIDDRADRLLAEHGEVCQSRISVDCPDDRKAAVLSDLESALPDAVAGTPVADVNTVDGFKIALEDGTWLLIRPSGTEPKLRVYAEAGSDERVEELLAAGADVVEPLV
ncbi:MULTISPECIES: phosphoglucomutase/phosphomannomutase family protein [Salinibaculum]|uniref:phosphoglucomutase/phosphomannomutase family protein n=1 Tax=Salinibaculum TaxID=2732368 RepID=UPI0030D41A19